MAEHGHGHEKAGGHGGKHESWMAKHMLNLLKATIIGSLAAFYAPAMLAAVGVIVPQYMAGVAGAGWSLNKSYGSAEAKGGHGGGHH